MFAQIDTVSTTEQWTLIAPQEGGGRSDTLTRQVSHKILIVEDELWSALDMEWVVASLGHETVGTAASAESALRMAEEFAPSLVLMDIRLAYNGDGIAAAMEIRRRFNISSIFVSAHGDANTRSRARAAMPASFIEKPFTPEALGNAIQSALGIKD